MIFVNFSNHPSNAWSDKQIAAARRYGDITDIAFPEVDANADEGDVSKLAAKFVDEIIKLQPAAVMCQGEFTLAYAVTTALKAHGIKVVSACSTRRAEDKLMPDGTSKKISVFEFVRFREYV